MTRTRTIADARAALHAFIDRLEDDRVEMLLAGLEQCDLLALKLALAPYDDEPLTDEDIAALDEAKADVAAGRLIPHAEVAAKLHARLPG